MVKIDWICLNTNAAAVADALMINQLEVKSFCRKAKRILVEPKAVQVLRRPYVFVQP